MSEKTLNLISGLNRVPMLIDHSKALILLNRANEAKPLIEEAWSLAGVYSPQLFPWVFIQTDQEDRAIQILDSMTSVDYPLEVAMGYFALDQSDNAFKTIESGIESQDNDIINSLRVGKFWDPFRKDARFDDMIMLMDSKITHTSRFLLEIEFKDSAITN